MDHFAQGVTRAGPAGSIFSSESAAPRIAPTCGQVQGGASSLAYGLASGAANMSRQAAGICASVIGGFGFGGSGGGFGWSTESLNQ